MADASQGSPAHSPEEIVATIQLGLAAEAFVCQGLQALAASHTGRVPGSFQDIQQKFVQYRLIATGTRIAHADRRLAATCKANANESQYSR